MTTTIYRVLFAAAALLAGVVGSCREKPAAAPGRPASPVTVAKALRQDVPVELRTFGSVRPQQTISVRSRVGGQLAEVHFAEGQHVTQGQLLFTIDPRPFEAAVNQAQANLDRDKQRSGLAQREVVRFTQLHLQGAATLEEVDTARTAAKVADATVAADAAAVESAKLDLSYCTIRSPVTGIAGPWLISQGNVVKANDDVLATVNQIQPIDVSFALPQQHLGEIRQHQAQGPLEVRALLSGGQSEFGKLTFIDNTVDEKTGTIRLFGSFPNQDEHLWPGLYVDVVLVVNVLHDAVAVPSQAIQPSQQGPLVFVVKGDKTVEARPVTTGPLAGGIQVIEKGLEAGETVVTDGQFNLAPGSPVVIEEHGPSSQPATASAPAGGAPGIGRQAGGSP